jgi:hypothetical protein
VVHVLPGAAFTADVLKEFVDLRARLGNVLRIVTLDEESTKVLFRDLAEIDQRRQRAPYTFPLFLTPPRAPTALNREGMPS